MRRLGVLKYIGVFTKVAPFDLAKALSGGMGARYGQALPVPAVVNTSGVPSSTPVHLGVLATRDSSLICPDFARKVYIPKKKQLKRRFPHRGGN